MPDISQPDSIRAVCHSRGNMKASRLLWLVWITLTVFRSGTFGQGAPPQPEVTRALLQAKTVYVIFGHVRYNKTKGFLKKELVDETPFEEPCRKELEKWGRFTVVPDIKAADLVIRAYEKGETNYVPVMSPGVTGSVNVGQSFFILDVWQPSSRKVIWSTSKNVGTSWSTHSGITNLVKKLREYVEEQEKSAANLDGVSKPGSANPQNQLPDEPGNGPQTGLREVGNPL
jgi:hypothetical protein